MYSRLKVKFCLSPMQHTRCLSVTFYSVLIILGLHASFLFYSQMILIMRERVWENNEELEDISDYTPLPKLGLGQTYWRKMWLSDELLWGFLHPHLNTHFTKMIMEKKGGGSLPLTILRQICTVSYNGLSFLSGLKTLC